jgi:hypothetical protein
MEGYINSSKEIAKLWNYVWLVLVMWVWWVVCVFQILVTMLYV